MIGEMAFSTAQENGKRSPVSSWNTFTFRRFSGSVGEPNHTVANETGLQSLRDDPRFQDLRRRMNLEP